MPRSLSGVRNGKVLYDAGNGRLLIVALDYDRFRIILFAVYAPTQAHGQEQVSYFEKLRDKLSNLSPDDSYIVLAWDFNVHLSELDVYKCRFRFTRAAQILTDMLNDMELIDVWRERNRTRRRYTWRRLNPLQQSQIDYVFASENLLSTHILKRIEIKMSVLSDHSILTLEMNVNSSDTGPGLWRFNPRPAGGGGAFERPPPPLRFFEDSEKTAARSAAGFSPTLPPIFSATFVKISTQCHMRSGHQVRSSDPTTK